MSDLSRLDRLVIARDRLASLIGTADESKAPALVREYRAVLAEIEKLDVTGGGSGVDQLAARRAARIAASEGSDAAEVGE